MILACYHRFAKTQQTGIRGDTGPQVLCISLGLTPHWLNVINHRSVPARAPRYEGVLPGVIGVVLDRRAAALPGGMRTIRVAPEGA